MQNKLIKNEYQRDEFTIEVLDYLRVRKKFSKIRKHFFGKDISYSAKLGTILESLEKDGLIKIDKSPNRQNYSITNKGIEILEKYKIK